MKTTIILASASPRREQLLRAMGHAFEVVEPCVDEHIPPGADPATEAVRLAELKARDVAARVPPAVIIGADTVVAVGDEILGKPRDRAHAVDMLRRLSGTRHRVITGVCVLDAGSGRAITEAVATAVTMRPMTDDQIRAYVDSGEADGKAGAYAIQETADRYVERIEGSFNNIVGLPTEWLAGALRDVLGC